MRSLARRTMASALALLIATSGASARAETLAEALALAYQTNPNIQAQRASQRALDETYVRARAGYGLNIQLQGQVNHRDLEPETGRRLADTTQTATLSVSQPIYTGGRVAARINAAEATVLAGRERLRRQEQDVLRRVIEAYVAVRRDEQILRIIQDSVVVLERQLEETEAKFNVRQVTRTDLAQAQGRLAAIRSQLANTRTQLAISRNQYLEVVGQNPVNLAPEPELPAIPATLDAALDAGEASNPVLLEARFTEQASRQRVAEARAANLPTVSLRADAGRATSEQGNLNIYPESFSASAVVTQPLFTGGANGSEIRRTIEQNNADALLVESSRRAVVRDVAQAWDRLVGAREALVTDELQVEADQTAFFGMREEERFGLRSTIEVLNAQQELTSSQVNLLRQRAGEYTARAALLVATGQLEPGALLGEGVDLYDPEVSFKRVRNKGAMPWEPVIHAVDSVLSPPPGRPQPAVTSPEPTVQLELPPAPISATEAKPITSTVEIMKETQMRPDPAPPPPPPPPGPSEPRSPATGGQ